MDTRHTIFFFCFKIMTELQSIIPAFRSYMYHRHSVSDWSFGQHIWFLQYVLPLPKVLAVLHSSFDVCHLAMLVRYCYKKMYQFNISEGCIGQVSCMIYSTLTITTTCTYSKRTKKKKTTFGMRVDLLKVIFELIIYDSLMNM